MEMRITGVPTVASRHRARPPLREEDVETARQTILAKLTLVTGKVPTAASDRDWFIAASLAARDRIVRYWAESKNRARKENRKRVYYLSLEFLIGRLLGEVLNNLELTAPFQAALGDLGVNLDHMFTSEPDAALGNGGLGRLAACFMESMASLSIPAVGYGIRYDHGLFRQVIHDGDAAGISGELALLRQSLGVRAPGDRLRRRFRRPR